MKRNYPVKSDPWKGIATRPIGPGTFRLVSDERSLARRAATLIEMELKAKPDLLLCVSSGRTPTGTYDALVAVARRTPRRFAQLRLIKIDEWAGLPADHPASCELYLQEHLVRPLGIPKSRYASLQGDTPDPAAECRRVERWLDRNGPIDLCILGLGENGHVALNEPSDAMEPEVHVLPLSSRSRQHPMIRTMRPKPTHGITLGMAAILQSRRILLLVSGTHKRAMLNRLRERRISTRFPASLLWLHPHVTVICDRAATGQ
jgi:galactosamine-6-phosphate isomerase